MRKSMQELALQGVSISDQGVWFSWPNILNTESVASNLSGPLEILKKEFKEDVSIIDHVYSNNFCMFKLPSTVPVLSSDMKREIRRRIGNSVSGYQVDIGTQCDKRSLYFGSKRRIAIGHSMSVFLHYFTPVTVTFLVCSLRVEETTISGNYKPGKVIHAHTELALDRKKPVEAKYKVILMNDSTIPLVRTSTVRLIISYPGQTVRPNNLYFNSNGPMIHKQQTYKNTFDTVIGLINGEIPKDQYKMDKGVNLCGIGIPFPLDKERTFHFTLFGEGNDGILSSRQVD